MGCHTWFLRPLTNDEIDLFRSNAINEALEVLKYIEDENNGLTTADLNFHNKIVESVNNGGDYWLQLGYGTTIGEKSESTRYINGVHYLDLNLPPNPIFTDIKRYHDEFRVKNYPRKIIHNRRELRRFMRKKYFSLTDDQLKTISEFFRENPKGIIMFG